MRLTIIERDGALIVGRSQWPATLAGVAFALLLILGAPLLIGADELFGDGAFLNRMSRLRVLDGLILLSLYSLLCGLGAVMLSSARPQWELRLMREAGRCECFGWDLLGRQRPQWRLDFAKPQSLQLRERGGGVSRKTGLVLIDAAGHEHAITGEEFALPARSDEARQLQTRIQRYLGLDAQTRVAASEATATASACSDIDVFAADLQAEAEAARIKHARRSERIGQRIEHRRGRKGHRARAASPAAPLPAPLPRKRPLAARVAEPAAQRADDVAPSRTGRRIAGGLIGACTGLFVLAGLRDLFIALTTGVMYMRRTRMLFAEAPFWFSFGVFCRVLILLLFLGVFCGAMNLLFGEARRSGARRS